MKNFALLIGIIFTLGAIISFFINEFRTTTNLLLIFGLTNLISYRINILKEEIEELKKKCIDDNMDR